VGHMNVLEGIADQRPGWARVGPLVLRHRGTPATAPGAAVTLGIRPEEIRVGPAAGNGDNRVRARVTSVQFQGAFTRLGLQPVGATGAPLECDVAAGALGDIDLSEGSELPVTLRPDALRVLEGTPAA
jgi:iron(III) transport system ATP-binding protein